MAKTMLVLFIFSAISCSSVWCQDAADVAPSQDNAAGVAVAADPATVPDTDKPVVIPDTAPVVPDTAPVVPDTAPVVPDTAPVVPDTAPVVPDTAPVVPDTAPVVPDTAPVVPDTAPVVPDTASVVPDTAPVVPDTAPVVPDTAPVFPDTASVVPDTVPVVPDAVAPAVLADPTTAPAYPTTVPADPTTVAPDTTTTATTTTTTTTVAPTPAAPTRGRWSVSDDASTSICVLAEMAVQMKIPYLSTTNKTMTAVINVPANASSEGSCGDSEYIRVFWPVDVAPDRANYLMLTFAENVTSGRYSVDSITSQLTMDDENFPDHASNDAMLNMRVNFSEPIILSNNTSYRCISKQPFQLLTSDDRSGQLEMLQTQLEAFRTVNTTKFSTPLVCSADHRATSDIVPIAVGVALASLVVIILIAYMVGRRRARQRGYQSV